MSERDDLLIALEDHPTHRMGCEWCEGNDAALARVRALIEEWDGWEHDDTLLAQTVVRLLRRALAGHEHLWVRHQNVTSSGYELPPYWVCSCGAAQSDASARGDA